MSKLYFSVLGEHTEVEVVGPSPQRVPVKLTLRSFWLGTGRASKLSGAPCIKNKLEPGVPVKVRSDRPVWEIGRELLIRDKAIP